MFTLQTKIQAAVPAKGHLQYRGNQATVAAVVSGQDQVPVNQGLHRGKTAANAIGIIHIRTFIAQLPQHLGQGRAAQTRLARSQVNEQQNGAGPLDIRGNHPGYIAHGRIGGDHQLPGRFHGLVIHHGGHGQAVFAAVNRHSGGNHGIAHGPGRIV